jgi:hypothetical protein
VLPRYLAASDLDQAKITPTDRAARIAMVTAIATATAQPASITHVGTRAGRCRNHAMLMAVTRTGPPLSRIPRPTRVG